MTDPHNDNDAVDNNDDDDDDDDDMAELFSFGSSDAEAVPNDPSQAAGSAIMASSSSSSSSSAISSLMNGTQSAAAAAAAASTWNATSTAAAAAPDRSRSGSNDSLNRLLMQESGGGADSVLFKSDHFKKSTTIRFQGDDTVVAVGNGGRHDQETQDILDWLEEDDSAPPPGSAIVTTTTTSSNALVKVEEQQKETPSSSPTPPVVAVAAAPTVVTLPPAFETLEQALLSSEATAAQVRSLAQKEQQQQHLALLNNNQHDHAAENNTKKKRMMSMVTDELRPEYYCRLVCGKTLQETLSSSLADSFASWQKSQLISNGDATASAVEQQHQDWIQRAADDLSTSIAQATGRMVNDCHCDLKDLLAFHLKGKDATTVDSNKDGTNNENEYKEKNNNNEDWLLPPVAATILSANIPVVAASVVLQQVIATHTPLLALQPSESWEAAQALHMHLYLLAAYHLPLLVFHLDRYLPGWYWPKLPAAAAAATASTAAANDMDDSVTERARHLDKRGQLPPSWLLSLQAGEWQGTRLPVVSCILPLWDVQLAMDSSSSHAARFFLTLAVLERAADRLIVLTGDALLQELQDVFERVAVSSDTNNSSSSNDNDEWMQKWWPAAMQLKLATPESVISNLNTAEDTAVQEALKRRQERAEAQLKARLEAEAKAYQQEQEKKADEARERLTRARLVAYYMKHAPDKEGNIDIIMENYKGRYEVLDAKLIKKYGESFNPAIKQKPKNISTTNNTNKLLATMNQGLHVARWKGGDGGSNGQQQGGNVDNDDRCNGGDQVSVMVSAEEVLPVVCWSKEAAAIRGECRRHRPKAGTARVPLKFFLVDARAQEAAEEQGRFPTAVSLSPEAMLDPERIKENEDMFESLRGAVHVVVMGEGFSAIPRLYGQKLSSKLEEAMVQDESRTNICALFFVKKGFPFVSVLNGGFCAAHSWLVREGSSRHLNASSVLIDYEPDNSLFGQMERLHNASTTEKAKRNMQYMLEKSLVAVTLKAQQLEKNLDQNQGIGNLRLGQIFGGGGNAAAAAARAENSDIVGTQTAAAVASVNGDETASNNIKGFKNPFARGTGWTSSTGHDEGSSDTAIKEEGGSGSNTMVPQFLNAFGRKQAGTTSDDASAGDANASTTTGEASTEDSARSQPNAEKVSTNTAPSATAASATPTVTPPPNPFAMFRQGKVNDEASAAAAAASATEKKPPITATTSAGQNSKHSFRGLGSWKAQAAAASSVASSFRFSVVANKKTANTEVDGGGSNSFAGLNNLRKSTLARMRSATDKQREADETTMTNQESIVFD